MDALPVRCTARRKGDSGRICDARLFDAVPGSVEVSPAEAPPPGCVSMKCPRCGTRYVVCARAA